MAVFYRGLVEPSTPLYAIIGGVFTSANEFALIAPILLSLTFSIIERESSWLQKTLLENATHSAACARRTGFVRRDRTREASVITIVSVARLPVPPRSVEFRNSHPWRIRDPAPRQSLLL